MCSDGFDTNDANVICRQLGFPKSTYHGLKFGAGYDRIWLADVECQGNEPSLESCFHPGWGINNCVHNQDVSVACRDGM